MHCIVAAPIQPSGLLILFSLFDRPSYVPSCCAEAVAKYTADADRKSPANDSATGAPDVLKDHSVSASADNNLEAGGTAHGDITNSAGTSANDDVKDPTVAVSRQYTADDGAFGETRPVVPHGSPSRAQAAAEVDSTAGFARGLADFMSAVDEQPTGDVGQIASSTIAESAAAAKGAVQSPATASAGHTVESDSIQAHEMPADSFEQLPRRTDGADKADQQLPSGASARLSTATDAHVRPSTSQVCDHSPNPMRTYGHTHARTLALTVNSEPAAELV